MRTCVAGCYNAREAGMGVRKQAYGRKGLESSLAMPVADVRRGAFADVGRVPVEDVCYRICLYEGECNRYDKC